MLAKKPTSQVLYLSETYFIIKKIIKTLKENKNIKYLNSFKNFKKIIKLF
jgi:hypothetical protein